MATTHINLETSVQATEGTENTERTMGYSQRFLYPMGDRRRSIKLLFFLQELCVLCG